MSSRPRLLGRERKALTDLLVASFDGFGLSQMVSHNFNPIEDTDEYLGELETFATGATGELAAALVTAMEQRDLVDALVRTMKRLRSRRADVLKFHDEFFGSMQRQVSNAVLEREVLPASRFLNPALWREAMARIEGRVCQIRARQSVGSGFLVSPDILLTNQHVIEDVTAASDVQVTFDHRTLNERDMSGVAHKLHDEWLLASSPPSQVDLVDPKPREATVQELDFAFLRLASAPGHARLNGDEERGWLKPSRTPAPFVENSTIAILQHPHAGPLRLALETQSVIGVNTARTRARYRTRTEAGSSGAPCFDIDWQLVALHHSGDPDFERRAKYNEGIPIDTIAAALPAALRRELGW
jgi:hypothetical protein